MFSFPSSSFLDIFLVGVAVHKIVVTLLFSVAVHPGAEISANKPGKDHHFKFKLYSMTSGNSIPNHPGKKTFLHLYP